MYCTKCGVELGENDRFCSQCGATTGRGLSSPLPGSQLRLSRPVQDRKLAGVCAGVARYFGLDVTLVRILWVILALWPPTVGLIAYVVCWIIMPKDPLALPAAPNEFITTTT